MTPGEAPRPAARQLTRVTLRTTLIAAAVLGTSVLWVSATEVRPSYDAFGWLVWGRETWRGSLNTSAAPSWKALPYLFTLPYALFGRVQMWLWEVTATAAALAGWLLAGRISYALAGGRRPAARGARHWPSVVAAIGGFLAIPLLTGCGIRC